MHGPSPRPTRRQRGSMAIAMMLMLLGLITILGIVEVGYLYWAHRDAQKVADLAALSGAQQLPDCTAAKGAALSNAKDNGASDGTATPDGKFHANLTYNDCGTWVPPTKGGDGFSANVDSPNAVKVIAGGPVPSIWGFAGALPDVSAEAVAAQQPPIAVFSVGSQLVRFNGNTPLGSLLKIIGVDLDQTTVLGYDGLAQIRITPEGLLKALNIPVSSDIGVGELNDLLAANKISLGDLLDATATVMAQNGVADVDLSALRNALAAKMDLDSVKFALGSSDDTPGSLFAKITAPEGSAKSALQADVDVLDLITTGISIANSGHGVEVGSLNILGLVAVQAGIVEPPSIGIGGIGTKAYNAQIRLYVDIDTDNALGGTLRPLLTLLGTRIHIPLYIDVVTGLGEIAGINCNAHPPTATISVESSILRSCIGKVAPADAFSTENVCGDDLEDEELVKLPGVSVNNHLYLDALSDTQELQLASGETKSTDVNPLHVGDMVNDIVNELLGIINGALSQQQSTPGNTASQLANNYLEATKDSNGRYNIDQAISLLSRPTDAPLDDSHPLKGLGDWTVSKGVPYACGVLNLSTCWKDGSVWTGLNDAVTGQGQGVVSGLLGTVLGGLAINNCSGLVAQLVTYNSCVQGNLASYLQTAPEGLFDDGTDTGGSCNGLLCIVLQPLLDLLKPVLNGVGGLLSTTLANVLGIEIGRTDVHLQSLQCHGTQLVY